jgi:hypothetical protein
MGAKKTALDFTNVKEGGNFSKKHMPAGDYLAKVTKVEDAKPKDPSDKTPMWLFTIQLKNTPSATYPYYCKLQENQLWKVRNMLVAAGINVPKKRVAVDPNKLVGKLIAVSLDDTEYDGKDQSEIGSVFSASELEGGDADVSEDVNDDADDGEDDEEPTPKAKKSKPAKVAADDDEEDEPAPKAKKKKAAPEEAPKKGKKGKKSKAEADDEIEIEDV